MPSLSRRREQDGRADRLESEIRHSEEIALHKAYDTRKGLRYCQGCGHCFEEYSVYCPRCDRKDKMGWIRRIPSFDLAQAKSRALERSKRRVGLI